MDISKYLAQGVSLAEVVAKQDRQEDVVKRMIIATASGDEFAWLVGRVGGGRDLFAEHRPQVVAWQQAREQYITNAHNHGEAPPLRDSESNSIVHYNQSLAKTGFNLLIEDLDRAVGKEGQLDKISLSLYWLCWVETAGRVINLMKSEDLLNFLGLAVYSLK